MTSDTANTLNFWNETFWAKSNTPWHKADPHEHLVKYYDRLFQGQKRRILLPLCGKSVDLKYLYEQGHEVVGVEGIADAIETFFKESGLEYTKSEFEDGSHRYDTSDKKLTILQKNFFELGSTYENYFDCVWDRGSFVAIEPKYRQIYADTLKRLVRPSFRYLLSTVEYDTSLATGPPNSLTKEQIDGHIGSWASVDLVEMIEKKDEPFKGQQLEWFNVGLFLISERK